MQHFKKEWAIYCSMLFTVILILIRYWITGNFYYFFLCWNLFLAWIPFIISQSFDSQKSKKNFIILFLIWLMFLPNAPYIITDLTHLRSRPDAPFYFDCILMFSAVWSGLWMTILSVYRVENKLKEYLAYKYNKVFIVLLFLLCGFGIYAGRFLRWNSWDIFLNPHTILSDLYERILNPLKHLRTWAFTGLFSALLIIVYYSATQIMTKKIK